jgi:hypothetical protein
MTMYATRTFLTNPFRQDDGSVTLTPRILAFTNPTNAVHVVADPCSFSSRDNRLVIFTITPACLTILFSIQHAMLML